MGSRTTRVWLASLLSSLAMLGLGIWQLVAGDRTLGFVLAFVGFFATIAFATWRAGEARRALGAVVHAVAELLGHWPG